MSVMRCFRHFPGREPQNDSETVPAFQRFYRETSVMPDRCFCRWATAYGSLLPDRCKAGLPMGWNSVVAEIGRGCWARVLQDRTRQRRRGSALRSSVRALFGPARPWCRYAAGSPGPVEERRARARRCRAGQQDGRVSRYRPTARKRASREGARGAIEIEVGQWRQPRHQSASAMHPGWGSCMLPVTEASIYSLPVQGRAETLKPDGPGPEG